ncbi:mitochondrial glycoprotein [Durotheca rogersii]|uniref:mitochondrial glycoprotein n=1 Tax=Durotheca rogersii TaxID=419775 RepID=UPI002220884A|nr:mitochondrial glycoprotein [Durotheca rogersii]KAI5863886.1 mitochondrial glycoprotein [Durotheca rogersii]
MMSLRAVARSAPRTLTRFSSTAMRQSRAAQPISLLKSTSWAPYRSSQFASAFSTSQFRRAPAPEVDGELSAKLESELHFEADMKEHTPTPASITDFLDNSPFKLEDVDGKEDLVLTRKFGNETITITFSISDLTNYDPDDVYNEDAALADEDSEQSEGKRQSANESETESEGEDNLEDEDLNQASVPCRLTIVVEKPGKGALNIEATAQDGQILVDNFYYYKDAKLAHASNAETSHVAHETYPGPPFGTLDEDLQVLLERYLEERGVNQALSLFVSEYLDHKEQREYHAWLKNVKAFIDA